MAFLLFRAKSKTALLDLLVDHQRSLPNEFKMGEGQHKACIIYDDKKDYESKLTKMIQKVQSVENEYLDLNSGLFYSNRKLENKNIGFVFPGQGSQHSGMFKNEYHQETFDKMIQVARQNGLDLEKIINSNEIDQTEFAQPALALVSYSMLKNLQLNGIDASIGAGHSFGELTALAFAGALTPEILMEMSIKRGKIMAKANQTAPGKMLAIMKHGHDSWESLQEELKEQNLVNDNELANINTQSQLIFSGNEQRILEIKKKCDQIKIKNILLSASAAFHSPLMNIAATEFSEYLKINESHFKKLNKKIISSSKNLIYKTSEDINKNLSTQLIDMVNWVNVIKTMKESEIKIFIEVGPREVLSKMIKEILPENDYLTLPLDKTPIEYIRGCLEAFGIEILNQKNDSPKKSHESIKENKIIKGFMAKQAALVEDLNYILDERMKDQIKKQILSDTEEVLSIFFSIDNVEQVIEKKSNDENIDEKARIVIDEIAKVTGFEKKQINLDAKFDNELYLDSITKIELLSNLSQKFKTEANDITSLLQATSIRELVEILQTKHEIRTDENTLSAELSWIRKEISTYTGINEDKIYKKTRFNEDLMLDSLIKMDLIGGLQSNFPQSIVDLNEVHKYNSLEDFELYFEKKNKNHNETEIINKKTNKTIRELLATHLNLSLEKILTTSDFELDLKMNIFEKEDFINSLLIKLPYLQLAMRELLHTKTFGEMLDIEKIFDRRSPNRSGDEEVERYTFEKEEVFFKRGENYSLGSGLNLLSYGSSALAWSKNLKNYFESKGIKLKILEKNHSTPSSNLILIIDQEWGKDLDLSVDDIYNMGKIIEEISLNTKKIFLKIIILGKNRIAESLISFSKSLAKEYNLHISIIKMESNQPNPNDIPWVFLSNTDQSPQIYFEEDGKFFIENIAKKDSNKKPNFQNFEMEPHILLVGGARGIASEIAKFLAEKKQARISILGRTSMGDQYPYADCFTDQDLRLRLKIEIDHIFREKKPEERVLEFNKKLQVINNQRDIWKTKSSIEGRGGKFYYYQVDATIKNEFEKVVKIIEERNGPIQGIIHAAGLTRDVSLKNKTLLDFKEVVFSKSKTAENLFETFKDRTNLSFVCFFSSLSSWSGAPGQTDYAWANEIVNLIAKDWNELADYPVTSLLWSVWNETGLAKETILSQMTMLKLGGITNSAGIRLFNEEIFYHSLSNSKVLLTPSSTLKYSLETKNAK